LGSYSAVTYALKSLCDKGQIRRLGRGVYDYPKPHPILGGLMPTPEQIASAVARQNNLQIQPSGAYAANLLGLSEQVPARIVFLTNGANRRISVGRQEIILKRTTPKNMATAGRISGVVIQALRYLGKDYVDDAVIDTLAGRLTRDDREQLITDIRHAPAWIGAIFRRLAKQDE
jgi:predicted transcriptional regulator of viral defense system